MPPKQATALLPLIVFSQFAGTSLWFATNAIINDISVDASGFANSTSMVQLGFITGTLVFSLLTIADRYPAAIVFCFSSFVAAAANFLLIYLGNEIFWLYTLRLITGFFLAGIYPIGMKIAADHFPQKLGNALGFLVGALVLGTAFPHLIRAQLQQLDWQLVIILTSALAFLGGVLVLFFVPTIKRTVYTRNEFKAAFRFFRVADFRSAAFGYFGHMWELYAFWAFIPEILRLYHQNSGTELNSSFWSFVIIASGCLGCIVGGIISKKTGSRKVAFYSLLVSGICCLCSPFFFELSAGLFLTALLIWGFSVVSDSPQFSTMVAQSAPAQYKGTALTIVTSIGFAITIFSIQFLQSMFNEFGRYTFLLLAIGPFFGILSMKTTNRIQHTLKGFL